MKLRLRLDGYTATLYPAPGDGSGAQQYVEFRVLRFTPSDDGSISDPVSIGPLAPEDWQAFALGKVYEVSIEEE